MIRTLFEAFFGWFFALFSSKPKRLTSGDLPVEFRSRVQGLSLRVDRATMMARIEPMLHLVGVLENRGDNVVHEISFAITAYRDETAVGGQDQEIVAAHHAALHAGDSHAFDLKIALKSDTNRVVVSTCEESAERARPQRPSPEAKIDWPAGMPPGIDLVFRERKNETHRFGDGRFAYCHLSLEVENGGRDVNVLKLDLRFFDGQGREVDKRETLAAWAGGPPLKRGERRLVHVISKVPANYTGYLGQVADVH